MTLRSPVLRPLGKARAGAWKAVLGAGTCGPSGQIDVTAGGWGLGGGTGTFCDELAEGACRPPWGTREDFVSSTEVFTSPKSLTIRTVYKIKFHRLKTLAEETRVQKQ